MMSSHGAHPIFFNKNDKDWTSRTLATPLCPITSHFCLNPPQSGHHLCIPNPFTA